MKAGKLDQRVTLERQSRVLGPLGQPVNAWAPLMTVWAAVEPLTGREYLAAGAMQAQVTTRVRMRYRPGIKATDRVIHDGRIFDIESVIDVRSSGRELVLMCRG